MEALLVRLMALAAFAQLGITLVNHDQTSVAGSLKQIANATQAVLVIPWKPISIFPEEAKRFR